MNEKWKIILLNEHKKRKNKRIISKIIRGKTKISFLLGNNGIKGIKIKAHLANVLHLGTTQAKVTLIG